MEITSKKTTRQYWRRTATSKPWWPWGIAPLVGLGALFLVGALLMAPRIEAEVRDQVSEQISAAGLPAFEIRGDGQQVTISTAAQAEQELYVHAVAASTRCDTWAGKLDCPTTVDVRRIERHDAAETQDMTASHETSVKPFESDETLDVNDSPNADGSAVVRDESGAIGNDLLQGGDLLQGDESLQGAYNVRTPMNRAQCNTDFDKLLSATSIRFQTSSAIIDAGNDELLDRLTELAKICPGNLTVQGHTDSRGDAAGNQALSLARATSVRDALAARGIELNRLAAKGFGESQPIADNTTLAGRAKNRRIEITIGEIQ